MEVTDNKCMTNLELRLGLPGTSRDSSPHHTKDVHRSSNKRPLPEEEDDYHSGSSSSTISGNDDNTAAPPTAPPPPKAQIVGWPPIRSYRKNNLQLPQPSKATDSSTAAYVKLSMDGAPYLRKIDLNLYITYSQLLKAMENMFRVTIGHYSEREGYSGSDYTPTYEDRDGDWMLVGDVPWTMFQTTCKRLRIVKSSEAKGLALSLHHQSS